MVTGPSLAIAASWVAIWVANRTVYVLEQDTAFAEDVFPYSAGHGPFSPVSKNGGAAGWAVHLDDGPSAILRGSDATCVLGARRRLLRCARKALLACRRAGLSSVARVLQRSLGVHSSAMLNAPNAGQGRDYRARFQAAAHNSGVLSF